MKTAWSAVTLLALATGAVAAQQSPKCEGGVAPRPDLNISLACESCTIGAFGQSASWSFASEPRVTAVHGGSARGLEAGDVIVRVNGYPITSSQGAAAFGSPTIGRAMVLTVRRDGALRTVQVVPGASCPEASRSTAVVGGAAPAAVAQSSNLGRMSGWLGIGFGCSHCSVERTRSGHMVWRFSSPPDIYSIDATSPAYRSGLRRGDVVTHVDGIEVTKEEAGRRIGAVQPGQSLRLTYRRGGETRTVSVRAGQQPAKFVVTDESHPAAQELRALLEAQERVSRATERLATEAERRAHAELLRDLGGHAEQQQRALRELESRLDRESSAEVRRAAEAELRSVRERTREQQQLINELLSRQQEETRRLQEIQRELLRSTGRVPLVSPKAPPARANRTSDEALTTSASRRLSYSGSLGGTDIEVRGPSPVVVTQEGDTITIQVGENTVQITQRRK